MTCVKRMDLSEEVKRTLIADRHLLSDDEFNKICHKISSDLITEVKEATHNGNNQSKDMNACSIEEVNQRSQFSHCLTMLLMNATMHDVTSDDLKNLLESFRWNPQKANVLVELFKKTKPDLRELVIKTIVHPPKIVDLKWELVYFKKVVTASVTPPEPYFIVSITTMREEIISEEVMLCSPPQIEDMLFCFQTMIASAKKLAS